MTTQNVATLAVQERTILGKKVSQLRRAGLTPIHLYGGGMTPQALQVDTQALRRTLTIIGHNRPVEVVADSSGERNLAFVREIQFHPLSLDVLHVDFQRVDRTITTTVEVPLDFTGESPAVRLGGSLIQGLYTVLLEARPLEIPPNIVVDISMLDDFDKSIRVGDLSLPAGVTPLTDPEQLVAHVAAPVGADAVQGDAAAPAAAAGAPEQAAPDAAAPADNAAAGPA